VTVLSIAPLVSFAVQDRRRVPMLRFSASVRD
jgi:hypothetical protein